MARIHLLLTLCLLALPCLAEDQHETAAAPTLVIAIHQNSVRGPLMSWQEQAVSCSHIKENFTNPKDRGAAELKIICHALLSSGVNPNVKLIATPNHVRSRFLLESGMADLAAESLWLEEINLNKVWASEVVITHGEFEKVPYTLPSHALQSTPASSIDLSLLTGITLRTWTHDWYTMTQLSKEVLNVLDQDSLFRLMQAQRGDYTLLEANRYGDDFFTNGKTTLLPIPGLYVLLDGTRHMIISKSSPHGTWARNYLNQGIKHLKQNGDLKKIYQSSGFMQSPSNPKILIEPHY